MDATSATSPPVAREDADPSSPPSARRFKLSQRSSVLDPAVNAYRDDLADIALAGQVIASHYAEPVMRTCAKQAQVTADASALLPVVLLQSGAEFAVLDCARGRAWGYVKATHRVGYIDEDALN